MIKPTVGRVVLFTPLHVDKSFLGNRDQVCAAFITYVFSDRLVNVAAFDANGNPHGRTSVPLLQDDDRKPEQGYFAAWMEYQKGQAAKTEALEQKIAG